MEMASSTQPITICIRPPETHTWPAHIDETYITYLWKLTVDPDPPSWRCAETVTGWKLKKGWDLLFKPIITTTITSHELGEKKFTLTFSLVKAEERVERMIERGDKPISDHGKRLKEFLRELTQGNETTLPIYCGNPRYPRAMCSITPTIPIEQAKYQDNWFLWKHRSQNLPQDQTITATIENIELKKINEEIARLTERREELWKKREKGF